MPDMLNPKLTASWEKGLEMVANSEIKSEEFMKKLELYVSSKINGFLYTPVIGMYVDTGTDKLTYEYGEEINISHWTAMQVRNDLRVGAIFDPDNTITWSLPNTKKYSGKQIVRANWTNFNYDIRVNVGVDTGTYVLDATNEAVKKKYRFNSRFSFYFLFYNNKFHVPFNV